MPKAETKIWNLKLLEYSCTSLIVTASENSNNFLKISINIILAIWTTLITLELEFQQASLFTGTHLQRALSKIPFNKWRKKM